MRTYIIALVALFGAGCAQLHHAQLGEIDNTPGFVRKPIDVKVSETGVDIKEAGRIGKALFKDSKTGDQMQQVAEIVSLFQMGPHTGAGVYVKDYAKNLLQALYDQCPSGRITGITSIRETRKYPVISGEIVKVTATCLVPKEG